MHANMAYLKLAKDGAKNILFSHIDCSSVAKFTPLQQAGKVCRYGSLININPSNPRLATLFPFF